MRFGFVGGILGAAAVSSFSVLSAVPAQAAGGPDMTVTMTPVAVAVGETVSVKAVVKNIGSGTAEGVKVVFVAPAGTTVEDVNPPNCTSSSDKMSVTCVIDGTKAPGWTGDGSATIKIQSDAAYSNAGTVTVTTDNDTNPANNSASLQIVKNGVGLPTGSSQ
jgi:subtilase family serine protease